MQSDDNDPELQAALEATLEPEPPRADSAPNGTHPIDMLIRPAHIDEATHLDQFVRYASKQTTAVNDYKYWGGAEQPWRNGVDDSPVTDAAVNFEGRNLDGS